MNIGDLRSAMLGRALRTKESPHQTIGKTVGMATFGSDSLSSVAYAGGEILLILSVIGASWYWTAIPITVAISGLLIIVSLSYRQTIFAYPSGVIARFALWHFGALDTAQLLVHTGNRMPTSGNRSAIKDP